jgi:hypothetical protein
VAVMVLAVACPGVTDLLPSLLREKSNETSFVNHALTTELGVIPLLNASAFTSAVAVRVKGAL